MSRRQVMATGAAAALARPGPAAAALPEGFYVPAEEAPHERCFMQWPVTRAVYSDRHFRNDVQRTITEIANTISAFEPVTMLASSEHHDAARRMLSEAVELWDIATDDLWCRDTGPLFAVDDTGGMVLSHIRFNGWGNKQPVPNDVHVMQRVAERLGLHVIDSGLIGEPGGVETDGAGLLMAHESCWVNDNRNPGLSRDEIEARLLEAYGAERMVWAPGLIGQDITDDHIDGLARLTAPGRAIMNMDEDGDPDEMFHAAALQTHDALTTAGIEVEVIPYAIDTRIPDTGAYVNYYVANGAVIASHFGDARTDSIAQDALARHYPGREIILLNTDPLTELGGGIHCATQQMPRTA